MAKETFVDFEANQRIHYRAALRGLYGLKNDIFYDPTGFEDMLKEDVEKEGGQE